MSEKSSIPQALGDEVLQAIALANAEQALAETRPIELSQSDESFAVPNN